MKKYIIHSNLFISIALCLCSCVDLDTPPYKGQTDLTYWNKPNSAVEALNSCYVYMSNSRETFYNDAMSDNAYTSKHGSGLPQSIGNGSYTTTDIYVQELWSGRYGGIRLCNKLLANISKVPELSDQQRNQYIGEAKVLRALNYYELLIRFGDIPYFTDAISIEESNKIHRTSTEEVLNKIIAEIDEVIINDLLPATYTAKTDIGRITKWGAMGLKARIYLSQNKWAELESVTSKIITESGLELFPSYEGLFDPDNENNNEVMIDVQYAPKIRDYDVGFQFLPPSMNSYCQLAPLQSLVDDYIMLNGKGIKEAGSGWTLADQFKNRDPRLAATIIYNGNSYPGKAAVNTTSGVDQAFGPDGTTPTGYYQRKYYDKYAIPGSTASGLNIIYLRYGDILLMHAEALAAQNKLNESEWNKTIRALRYRAGFRENSALNFPGGNDLLNIVRRERRSELALEGLRYTDIIRWKIAETVLNGNALGAYTGESGTIVENGYRIVEKRKFDKTKQYLWPIPENERFLNNNLGQNPNW
ncbi:RagB/SusD family nutrient uptake outer membrane protein [Dysgonomonas reticulitermitis]